MSFSLKLIWAFISLGVVTVWGLTLTGIVQKVYARVQGRLGPPVWQPFIDIIKNNAKRTAISHGIMFYLGPVFRIAGGIGTYIRPLRNTKESSFPGSTL